MHLRGTRARWRAKWLWRMAGMAAFVTGATVGALPPLAMGAQTSSGYLLNWSSVAGSGRAHMRSSCYILSGSIDFQSAPNNSSILTGSGSYVLYSGFWWAAPISDLDEIFFDGFEECKQ